MSGESPAAELYDSEGNPLAVQNGVAIPANTPALMLACSDGTNSRYLLVDSSGRSVVSTTQQGNIDAGNSSTTPLAGNGTFSGTGIDVSGYGVISIFVFTDKAGTLNIEFSTDNTNWDEVIPYSISASTAEHVQIGPLAKFFRVVYQNGGSAQSVFRLQTIERTVTAFNPVIPIAMTVDGSQDAILTKSVITGKTAGGGGGGYVDVKVTPSGALITDEAVASTTSITSIAASASNVTLLSSNTNRLGATIWNDSTTATLYVSLGTGAASTSNYTAQLFPSGYYEVPYGYIGQINGIWSAAVGNARITELT